MKLSGKKLVVKGSIVILVSISFTFIFKYVYPFSTFTVFMELKTYDLRFIASTIFNTSVSSNNSSGIVDEQTIIEDIIIVDIDQRSINKLGKYYRWSTDHHCELLDYLNE